jgi:hypothetical protein
MFYHKMWQNINTPLGDFLVALTVKYRRVVLLLRQQDHDHRIKSKGAGVL